MKSYSVKQGDNLPCLLYMLTITKQNGVCETFKILSDKHSQNPHWWRLYTEMNY